jgi:hypothetical protein
MENLETRPGATPRDRWRLLRTPSRTFRGLNPNQTFFFSTQFFFRHIFDYDPLQSVPIPEPNNSTRTVPLPQSVFLQTLLINTTYNVKAPGTEINLQMTPGFSMFYDWQGMLLFQPSLRFIRDPWRFVVDYTTINSGVYRYQLGGPRSLERAAPDRVRPVTARALTPSSAPTLPGAIRSVQISSRHHRGARRSAGVSEVTANALARTDSIGRIS